MTNDEAIKEFQSELRWAKLNTYPYISDRKVEADKMAIKALKQESILDKIRSEINEYKSRQLTLSMSVDDLEKGKQIALECVLAILDKYKAESEEIC